MKALLTRPYAAFTGSGGKPTDMEVEADMYNVYSQYKQGMYECIQHGECITSKLRGLTVFSH